MQGTQPLLLHTVFALRDTGFALRDTGFALRDTGFALMNSSAIVSKIAFTF